MIPLLKCCSHIPQIKFAFLLYFIWNTAMNLLNIILWVLSFMCILSFTCSYSSFCSTFLKVCRVFDFSYKFKLLVEIRLSSLVTEAVVHSCSVKKGVLRNFTKFTENTCAKVSSLIKLQGWDLQLYLKRDSVTCVFLWILRNF